MGSAAVGGGARTSPRRSLIGAAGLAIAVLTGCGGPLTEGGVTILRYGPMDGGPTALAHGELAFRDGCVVLLETTQELMVERSTILWPAGTDLRRVGSELFVVLGGVGATEGNKITLGGGEQVDQAFVERLVGPVGACGAERYWMATSLEVVAQR